jgi:3-methyladenine DNA glycosylase/8-oxoguanine DNA glycosylase
VDTVTRTELEMIPGIGPKTARYFLMYTRPEDADAWAAIDTHVKKYLAELGVRSGKYEVLEAEFLSRAKVLGMTSRELDDAVWAYYARGVKADYLFKS